MRKADCPHPWLPQPAIGEELAMGPRGTKRESGVGTTQICPCSQHNDPPTFTRQPTACLRQTRSSPLSSRWSACHVTLCRRLQLLKVVSDAEVLVTKCNLDSESRRNTPESSVGLEVTRSTSCPRDAGDGELQGPHTTPRTGPPFCLSKSRSWSQLKCTLSNIRVCLVPGYFSLFCLTCSISFFFSLIVFLVKCRNVPSATH